LIDSNVKMNLFFRLNESDYVKAGSRIVDPVETPVGKVGLAICYDLRFPELSAALRHKGADILTYPSAFTVETGYAHWETLLRSRYRAMSPNDTREGPKIVPKVSHII
jgi:predicted amidohydrolase